MRSGTTKWPNLFIVGAARAGTTSLWWSLGQHPEIYMSALKEPYFFSPAETTASRRVEGEATYLRLFAAARDERYRGEASPSYIWDPSTPDAIDERVRDARVIIALRDPVDRAYSAFLHARRSTERRTFLQVVEDEIASLGAGVCPSYCVGRSFYADSVARHIETFGERGHVVFFDELVHDPLSALRGICSFLGVDPTFADTRGMLERRNAASVARNALAARLLASPTAHRLARNLVPLALQARIEASLVREASKPELDGRARKLLRDVFEPDTERLRSLLERPVPW